mmetsp:Transcript_53428/g.96219  ORF Transcript_53428/g.96219 Transcript_53428/m.96219 type:complete len:261 (+) Transcript_53428:759-1541(+)
MPRATDSLRSTHHLSCPSGPTEASENTTWPSVTAFASSTKSSGTPETPSSGRAAIWLWIFSTAFALTASSRFIDWRFFNFASNSSLPRVEESLGRAKPRSVSDPPPLASAMRPARCRKQPRKVRLRAVTAFFFATYFHNSTPRSSDSLSISSFWSLLARSVRFSAAETSARIDQTLYMGSRSSSSKALPPSSRQSSASAHAAFMAKTASPGRASSTLLATMVTRLPASASPTSSRMSWASSGEAAATMQRTSLSPWAVMM